MTFYQNTPYYLGNLTQLLSRPYSSLSIDLLEAESERAIMEYDLATIELLAHELSFRKTNRAQALAKKLVPLDEVHTPSSRAKAPSTPGRKTFVKPSFKPTDEQRNAVDLFRTGESLKINAYAGAGKTSTLTLLAHSVLKQGQYIAFNKDIVNDAKKKFPSSVNCSTTHGLAYKAAPLELKSDVSKMTGRVNAHHLADGLKLKKWVIDGKYAFQPRSLAFLFLETLKRYAQSGDSEPLPTHVPRHGSLATAPDPIMKEVAAYCVQWAKHLWVRMCTPKDPLPLGHDGYLKLWAISNPEIATDFILLDEAQDINPVILELLKKQSAQMVYVGDKYQQIYEWRGAVNAMENISTQHFTSLTTSFRFGHSIAEYASSILSLLGEREKIQGNPALDSRIGCVCPRAILARTNSNAISATIEELDARRHPYLVGGSGEMLEMLKGVQDLRNNEQSTVPEFFGFLNWKEVVEFAKSGEAPHLLTFVNLVESRGEKQLMWALKNTVDEANSDVTISTAHKAKGREWHSVKLMDDFLKSKAVPNRSQTMSGVAPAFDPAELRLYYVAVTRAKAELEIPETLRQLISI